MSLQPKSGWSNKGKIFRWLGRATEQEKRESKSPHPRHCLSRFKETRNEISRLPLQLGGERGRRCRCREEEEVKSRKRPKREKSRLAEGARDHASTVQLAEVIITEDYGFDSRW